MGKYAVVKDNFVENIIILNESQIEEFENILDRELVDATPFNLSIGDMRVDENWTRNENGVQIILSERVTYEELEKALMEIQAKLAEV